MDELDIPIFKKLYELYGYFRTPGNNIPRQDRFAIWQRCDNLIIELLENIMLAGQTPKLAKLPLLRTTSAKLNVLRVLLRLCKDSKIIDLKKYIRLQTDIDQIGRMLGGWIRSTAL